MNTEQPIWYEPHPVTPERKAELRACGVRILDAQFMPEGYENPGDDGKPKAKPSDGLKVEEIKTALADKGVDIPEGVTLKADLAELLDAS